MPRGKIAEAPAETVRRLSFIGSSLAFGNRTYLSDASKPLRLRSRCEAVSSHDFGQQAMNQLLRSLERLGYIVRSDVPNQGRARLVRFTQRGKAAYSKIHGILRDIERGWSTELGPERFAQLKELLLRVWESPLIIGISTSCEKRRQVQKSVHHRNISPNLGD
jgi:hypothetical protein